MAKESCWLVFDIRRKVNFRDLALKLSPFDPNGVAKEGRPTGVVSAFAVQKLLGRGAVEQHLYLNFFTFVPGPDGIIA